MQADYWDYVVVIFIVIEAYCIIPGMSFEIKAQYSTFKLKMVMTMYLLYSYIAKTQ